MQPDIVRRRLMKGDLFVLPTILANQQRKALPALDMQRHTTAGRYRLPLRLFTPLPLFRRLQGLLVQCSLASNVASRQNLRLDMRDLSRIFGQLEICKELFHRRQLSIILLNLRRHEFKRAT